MFFIKEFLSDVEDVRMVMKGRCNARITTTSKRGLYGKFHMWLNENGIVNLISIPMLEASGYVVSTHTMNQWEVITSGGDTIHFKQDTGVCAGMPYINLYKENIGFAIISTIYQNFEG